MTRIDVSILVPNPMRDPMEKAMIEYLGAEFPDAEINFILNDDSKHDARMYILAVAHSESGLRWGRDFLYDRNWKKKQVTIIAKEMAKIVTKRVLEQTIVHAAAIDDFLQDQLVVFQALAEGRTAYWSQATEELDLQTRPSPQETIDELNQGLGDLGLSKRMRRDKPQKPFGFGSTHTTTARWVTSELLPTVQWFNNGTTCEGVGMKL
ncbi:putative RNA 3 -terminal phosphate cyclase [Rosellinia necatrix]|uniref:Putative RNA 3-terminal phosphate cyclase n=1 Tax=Rosellinia necatrix TaxID=77044 RepID=A0A1S8A825_ROSNE|nr:putative RNA 3 -terminal phosphate cyclase [Rosellinia necatrix]